MGMDANPIVDSFGCCALAASGHAAAPPISLMNSRRFIVSRCHGFGAGRWGATMDVFEFRDGLVVCCFIAPLLPFRGIMQRNKSQLMSEIALRLRHELEQIREKVPKNAISKEDEELIERLRKIGTVITRPGGNATGFTTLEPTMAGKWLELLKEIAPRVNRAALLFNPTTMPSIDNFLSSFKSAAASLSVEAVVAPVHDTSALEWVVATQAREPNGGLIVMPDTFMTARHAQVASLAAHHRLPVITPWRFNAELGGLISYGIDVADNFRRAAGYVDRILKGEKPADLPVQASTKYELVINLKTAKALGIEIPPTLLARADEVIE
jgi:ABC transporter substrate binding protein